MEYEKQTWVTGNRITAEKLNHMEDGIESANSGSTPFVIRSSTKYENALTVQRGSFNELASYFDPDSLELIEPLDVAYIKIDATHNDGYLQMTLERARAVKVDGEIAFIKLQFHSYVIHGGDNCVVIAWLPDDTLVTTDPAGDSEW